MLVVAAAVAEQLAEGLTIVAVEIAGGFVSKDEGRVGQQGAGNGHALLFTATKLIGVDAQLITNTQSFSKLDNVIMPGLAAIGQHGQGDVVMDIEGGDQIEGLEDETDVAPAHGSQAPVTKPGDVVPVNLDLAGAGGGEAGDDVQEGAFAGAARAHDSDHLAAVGVHGQAFKNLYLFISLQEALGKLLDGQRCRAHTVLLLHWS